MTNRAPEDRITRLETTVWGSHGSNGLNATSRRHSAQIGELYGRDETIRKELRDGDAEVRREIRDAVDAINEKLDKRLGRAFTIAGGGAFTVIATLIGAIVVLISNGGAS